VETKNIKINDIRVENRIRKDFGNIEELADSIKQYGLLQPIVVTPDLLLLAGERRLRATQTLGWTEIPAIIKTATDREEQLLCEIAENEKRKDFTPSERVAYGKELEQIQALKALERQHATLKRGADIPLPSIDGNGEKGETDQIVGQKVGMSGTSYRRAKRVVESGNSDIIQKMDSKEIGIETAYNIVKGKVPKPKPEPFIPAKPRPKPTAEPNEATRYLSDLNRVEGMNTPDREAQRMCSDIGNSINLLMYAMGKVVFSELSQVVRTEVEESVNRLDGIVLLIRDKLKGVPND